MSLRIILACIVSLLLGGCGAMWVDSDGIRHVVGIGHVRIRGAADAGSGGEAIGAQTVGISMSRSEAGMALAIGYADTRLAFVRNDSCVLVPALSVTWPGDLSHDPGESHAYLPSAR